MSSEIPLLSNVKVAAPCSASWNEMDAVDGDRVHFCAGCKKYVYNLSALSQNQAEGLLRRHEGHLCVRYYKRTDGMILTRNCPVGQAALRMKMIAGSKRAALAAAALASIGSLSYGVHSGQQFMGSPVRFRTELSVPGSVMTKAVENRQTTLPEPERAPLMGEAAVDVVEYGLDHSGASQSAVIQNKPLEKHMVAVPDFVGTTGLIRRELPDDVLQRFREHQADSMSNTNTGPELKTAPQSEAAPQLDGPDTDELADPILDAIQQK